MKHLTKRVMVRFWSPHPYPLKSHQHKQTHRWNISPTRDMSYVSLKADALLEPVKVRPLIVKRFFVDSIVKQNFLTHWQVLGCNEKDHILHFSLHHTVQGLDVRFLFGMIQQPAKCSLVRVAMTPVWVGINAHWLSFTVPEKEDISSLLSSCVFVYVLALLSTNNRPMIITYNLAFLKSAGRNDQSAVQKKEKLEQ